MLGPQSAGDRSTFSGAFGQLTDKKLIHSSQVTKEQVKLPEATL